MRWWSWKEKCLVELDSNWKRKDLLSVLAARLHGVADKTTARLTVLVFQATNIVVRRPGYVL